VAEILIDFEWWRDPRGTGYVLYEWRGIEPLVNFNRPMDASTLSILEQEQLWGLVYHPYGITVLGPSERPLHVGRDSFNPGELQPYRPLDCFKALYAEFAKITTPEDVLHFVERFGPLTKEGLKGGIGELVNGVITHAEKMRMTLAHSASRNWQSTVSISEHSNPFTGLQVYLDTDPAEPALRLRLAPASLLDALWLQAVQELSRGATVRQCRHCGQWFETGGQTGRRIDAKFCCDQHRISYNSLKRRKSTKPAAAPGAPATPSSAATSTEFPSTA
jgi:hypothetical protein